MSEVRRLYVMAAAFAVAQGVGCATLLTLVGNSYWWLGGLLATLGTLPIHMVQVRSARKR